MQRPGNKVTHIICLVTLLGLFTTLAMAQDPPYRRFVVFGDSLSDPGNAFELLQRAEVPPYDLIPDAPYARGGHRFSNGATWVERLARSLGVGVSAGPGFKAAKKFTNYAVGSARARLQGPVDLTSQVNLFLSEHNGRAGALALYVMFFGNNDLRDALQALSSDPSGATSAKIVTATITAIQENIQTLADSGASVFLVPNAPNIAHAPAVRLQGPLVQGVAQQLSVSFNTALAITLSQLETNLSITILRLDVFSLVNQAVADPASFGLSDVEQSCITPGVFIGAVCEQPQQYLFWDGLHPTRAGHAILANAARAVVSNP